MADALLFAAYAAGKWLEKRRRDQAAVDAEAKKKQEAEAKALAETRVQPFGRKTPTGPIQALNPMDKDFPNYTVTHRRFGTGEVKEVAPTAQTRTLFRSTNGEIGTEDFFKGKVVSDFGKFGDVADYKLKPIGTSIIEGNKVTNDFYPEYVVKGDTPKNVFVFEGATKDGTPVFGRTAQEARTKGAIEGSIGQKSVTPDVATALGYGDSVLSTTQKAFVPATPKEPAVEDMRYVGDMPDGRIIYADSAAELRDQGAVRVGEAKFTTVEGRKRRTGSINWLDKTEDEKKETKQFASVYMLDDNGERVDDKMVDIPLWKYREGTSQYELVTAYQKDETGQRSSINIGVKSASETKGAIDVSLSPFDIKYKNTAGKEQHFYIPEKFKSAEGQLSVFRNWIENLPRKADGTPDWTTAAVEPEMNRIRNYAVNLIAGNTAVKDPETGELIPSKQLLVDEIAFLRNNFPVLSTIPDLEAAVQVRAGLKAAEVTAQLTRENSVAPDGSPQSVIVATVPAGDIPATAIDPTAAPDAPTISAKIPLAIPFDPKYNDTVDFVMAQLAPSGTPAEIENAKRSFKSLVNFEYNPDGTIKKGPEGQVTISKTQPKLDFLTYLVKTKDVDSTPFFSSWQNMLKLGAERKTENANVEADIRLAFNNAFDGNFEEGIALISAFSPPVTGTARDRLLWAAQSNKDSRLFAKERSGRIQQADSAANAVSLIDKMIQTYYTRDGQFIDINTTLGQFYVSADGAVHLFQQGIENVLPGVLPIGQDQAIAAAQNSIFGKDRNGKPAFLSIVDNQLPAAEMLEIAKQRGYKSVDAFLEAERGARQENMTAFQKSVAGLGSNDEKVKNLALRNYYRYMVAYSMAAAIQGGTGGRTISDQDVQNILRALKMDSVFGQASTEVEILTAAKEMLVDIEKHSRAVGQGGMRAYSALKLQELSLGNVGTKLTIGDVTDYLEQPGGSGAPTKEDKAIVAMSDADKLKAINDAQGKFADTYNTLEEATAALGDAGVARILAQ